MSAETKDAAAELKGWRAHKFMLLVAGTIAMSIVLVVIAMAMYTSSGAAQLDLSGPGYKDVQSKADRGEAITAFPATGPLDQKSLNDFRTMYDSQAKQVLGYDSFGGDPMSDQALGLDMSTPAPTPGQ